MTKRGKILRDTSTGPGLLSIDGNQHQFTLEGIWKAADPPKPGMQVLAEFSPDSSILSVIPIPESQIATEHAEAMMKAAREKGGVVVSAAVAKFGWPLLIVTGGLIVGWFFLNAGSVQTPFGNLSYTFWQVLGCLNAGNAGEVLIQGRGGASGGFWGFMAFVALAGPFLHYVWKDKRATLGGLLPLVFMLFVAVMVRSSFHSVMGGAADGPLAEMQRRAQQEMMNAISLGAGTYLSAIVALYLAAVSAKQFLVAGSVITEATPVSSKAAA
jgi:hypothetical protein